MDTSANPCVDFYQYSCGGWNARNPLGTAGAITRFGEVNTQNTESLRNVIESGRDGDVRAVQLARRFYDSCMNTKVLDSMGSQPLVQLVRSMDGWSLIDILNCEFFNRYEIMCLGGVGPINWCVPQHISRMTAATCMQAISAALG